jgi:hypothetical protein
MFNEFLFLVLYLYFFFFIIFGIVVKKLISNPQRRVLEEKYNPKTIKAGEDNE